MSNAIRRGDVVRLRSGGPDMTVRWVEDEYGEITAFCDWFDGGEQRSFRYFPEQLVRVEPVD